MKFFIRCFIQHIAAFAAGAGLSNLLIRHNYRVAAYAFAISAIMFAICYFYEFVVNSKNSY